MKIEKMNVSNNLNQVKNYATSSNIGYMLVLIAILLAVIFFASSYAMTTVSVDHAYIQKLYIESDGESHLFGFKLCAGDEPLHFAKVIVSSDSELITLNPDGVIAKGDCRIFGVHINAKNTDSIQAKIVEPIRA